MSVLTKEAILAANDYKKERVDVPEWGKDAFVFVRTLTGKEKTEFHASLFEENGNDDGTPIRKRGYTTALSAGMLVRAICDEQGRRIFDDDDIEALAGKSALVLDRLEKVCNRLNGVNADNVEEAAKK